MKSITGMGLGCWLAVMASGQEFNNVEYLCCDWGPAITLPCKPNETVQYNEAEDEVYFLKQVTSVTQKKFLPTSRVQNLNNGVDIWLCKMKADGSGKIEIKKLWQNPNYPVDTQTQSTWMDVHRTTRKLALSITFAGSDLTGLWTVNLDGSGLKRIINPSMKAEGLQAIDSPSWTPDGASIVFGESFRGGKEDWGRISKCDKDGQNLVRLSDGAVDCQPRVSPDGKTIAYVHRVRAARRLYLMGIDGSNQHPLPNPDDKRWHTHGGSYPAWSPDGERLFLMSVSCELIEVKSGKKVAENIGLCGWPHWERPGLIGVNNGGILLTDIKVKESKWLAGSGLSNRQAQETNSDRW